MNDKRAWLITGIGSGIGYELTKQILEKGEYVFGTIKTEQQRENVRNFVNMYPSTFKYEVVDITDPVGLVRLVDMAFQSYPKLDVVVSNAGYGLFGALEEYTKKEIDDVVSTNLLGSIMLIKHSLSYLRKQGGGRIVQISCVDGQVTSPGCSVYNATKFGIEGFCESLVSEIAPFNIGLTIVEPGSVRTEFRYSSAVVARFMNEYNGNPAHEYLDVLDKSKNLADGDPTLIATRIIESVEMENAPLRLMLGSNALNETIKTLESRLDAYKKQADIASSTDYK